MRGYFLNPYHFSAKNKILPLLPLFQGGHAHMRVRVSIYIIIYNFACV